MQTHPVAFGNDHAKIVIIPQDQEAWTGDSRFSNRTDDGRVYATLGAGPENKNPFNLGRLMAGYNRKKDVILDHNTSSVSVIGNVCVDNAKENALIEILFYNHESYRDNLSYDFFPSETSNTFNSNSYISGLLLASGYVLAQPVSTPGFEVPVPITEFVY